MDAFLIGVIVIGPVATVGMLVWAFKNYSLVRSLRRAEDIDGLLTERRWYISRFALVCLQYLMTEAAMAGVDEESWQASMRPDLPGRHSVPRHRLEMMSFSRRGNLVGMAIGQMASVLILLAFAISWRDEVAWLVFGCVAALVTAMLAVVFWVRLRDDRQVAIGRKVSMSMSMPPLERAQFFEAVAAEELDAQAAARAVRAPV